MVFSAMLRFLPLLLVCLLIPSAPGQNAAVGGIDLLYPEFAHPREDAFEAIKKHDYRFVNIDRHGKDVPSMEHYGRFVEIYGTRFVKQRFRIFATPSQNFSFVLRARVYAREYNETLLHYLLQKSTKE
jgi:hypothetical protein